MKRRKLFFLSPLFRQFFASYMFALVLPMAVLFLLVWNISSGFLNDKAREVQLSSTQQLCHAIEYETKQCYSMSVGLASSQNLLSLLLVDEDDMDTITTYRMYNLRRMLSTYLTGMSSAENILIYMPKSGYCVDIFRALRAEEYRMVTSGSSYICLPRDTWKELTKGSYQGNWLRVKQKNANTLHYVKTVLDRYSRSSGLIIISIRSNYMDMLMQSKLEGEGSWAGFLTNSGNLIYGSSLEMPMTFSVDDFPGREGVVKKDNYFVSYARTKNGNYICVQTLSTHAMELGITKAWGILVTVFIACLIVLAVLTYLMTLKNYNPIRQLLAYTQTTLGDDQTHEYTRLRYALQEAADEKRLLIGYSENEHRIRQDSEFLQNLLSKDGLFAYRRRLEKDGFDIPPRFFLVQVKLLDYSKSALMASSCMVDIVGSALDPTLPHIMLQQTERLLVLAGLLADEEDVLRDVQQSIRDALQILEENYAIACSAAVGNPRLLTVNFSTELVDMIHETNAALHQAAGNQTVINCRSVGDKSAAELMLMTVRQLIQLADTENQSLARETLNRLNLLAHQLLSRNQGMPNTEIESESPEYLFKQRIIAIVENNYSDPSLSVGAIADMLGKSPDYVSRTFKQTTLIGLLDYIHHTRIYKAVRLLNQNPDLTITNVAERVGYLSVDSFIRAFKRILGETPGKYRDRQNLS
ncbi:MAG: helix-turn-helix transcriptional regulator [Christensenellales bacterium]